MPSDVTICNMALGRIGIDQTIEDLNDASARARACKLWYAHCRDTILGDAPWNWAMKVVSLATVSGDPPVGWAFQYAYPTDCLALRDITDEAGGRQRLDLWLDSIFDSRTGQWYNPRYPFEVRMGETSKIIVTDLEVPYALYTARVTDTSMFDAKFVDTLAWRLAMELAQTLSAPPDMLQKAVNMYQGSMSSALARFMNEQRPDRKPDSVSITARL